jgi:CRISPR system Cascade subunit CasB
MAAISQLVYGYTQKQLYRLANTDSEAEQRKRLAELRKGLGQAPGQQPQLWGYYLQDMPPELYSKSGEPTKAEWAVYTALTLYALHQQGHNVKNDSMNHEKISLGAAMSRLATNEEERARVWRRFSQAATADDLQELSYYLRGLIQLLRSKSIPLDYPALAKELYLYQLEDCVTQVRLRWGQDFYRQQNQTDIGKDESHG